MNPLPSPWVYIVVGLLAGAVLGGLMVGLGQAVDLPLLVAAGYLVAALASVPITIGMIAAGVRLGVTHADIDRGERN